MNQLLKKAKTGQFKLPQFQRDFVWNEAQVALLIDSIARNYPIGSLLLLEPSPDIRLSARSIQAAMAELDDLPSEDSGDNNTPEEAQELLILDGQQRLTSIVRVLLNANPSKTYWFDLQELYESFDEERVDWIKKTNGKSKDTTRSNNRWLRADLIHEGEEQKYVIDYFLNHPDLEKDEAMNAIKRVNRIFETIRNYEVPYILLEGQEGVEAICRIFETINSTGTRLSTFDLAVARYYPDLDLRAYYEEAHRIDRTLDAFSVDGERFLQVIVLLEKNAEPSRSEQLKLGKDTIKTRWIQVTKALSRALRWAQKECGLEPRFYVGESQLVALAGVLADLDERNQERFLTEKRDQLVQWFFSNALQSGFRATNYRILMHYQSLKKLVSGEIPNDDMPIVNLDLETLVGLAKSDNRYKAVLALLRRYIPEDFFSGSKIESDNFEIHHIFPRSFGAKKQVDSIANLVPLTRESNQLLSNRNPSDYVHELANKVDIDVANQRLGLALFPIRINPQKEVEPNILSDEMYDAFLRERGTLILQKIKKVVGNRFTDNPQNED